MIWFLKKGNRKHGEHTSPAEQAARDFANMSARDHKKMMKRVIRKASEDQLKVLRGTK